MPVSANSGVVHEVRFGLQEHKLLVCDIEPFDESNLLRQVRGKSLRRMRRAEVNDSTDDGDIVSHKIRI